MGSPACGEYSELTTRTTPNCETSPNRSRPVGKTKTTPSLERRLSEEELEALRGWSPEFLCLPVHNEILHQMRLAMDGVESTAVLGARGVGKSYTLRTLAKLIEDHEVERALDDPGYAPRRVVVYEASVARGAKTALIDLYEELVGRLSSTLRRSSPRRLVEDIAWELQAQRICLVCVDEAQMIDATNLDQLRQVLDATAKLGHPFGFIFAGSEELRASLIAIKQLGQRVSAEVTVPPITANEIAPFLPDFHPHLASLKETLPKSEWNALEREIFRVALGKFRRLRVVLANANALAIQMRRPIDAEILRLSIHKLADEV